MKKINEDLEVGYFHNGEPIVAGRLSKWAYKQLESAPELFNVLTQVYDYYMGPSACGDFTCDCHKPDTCGICEMKERVEKILETRKENKPCP